MTNKQIARLLRDVSAAYQVTGENRFKIIAYEKAADAIENFPSEAQFLWKDKKLGTIPGIGSALFGHLDELFKTGKVSHFERVMKNLPAGMFALLRVQGFGPKRAFLLAKTFKLTNAKTAIGGVEKAAKQGKIAELDGFGEKSQEEILKNIQSFKSGRLRKDQSRMSIHQADQVAYEIIKHLGKGPAEKIDILGSLRRRLPTIGDIDIAVATKKPKETITHFLTFPKIEKVIEKGPTGASIVVSSGAQVDLRVQTPEKYGAMLQYFTGSKTHNIRLRERALKQGKSLSEYGIKEVQSSKFKVHSDADEIEHSRQSRKNSKVKIQEFSEENTFYKAVGLPWIPPELREDRGEIEAALNQKLPHLVEASDIKGDLHLHSNYNLQSSHDIGQDSIVALAKKAETLGYGYIGLSDHNPKQSENSPEQVVEILKKRKEYIEQIKYSSKKSRVQILLMMEIDILPNGELAIPDEGFEYLDAAIVSIHSRFSQSRDVTTKRILTALSHPKVKILGHPTARLIGKREGIQADWSAIFTYCVQHKKAIEINAAPPRLDLPDVLVQQAAQSGVQFVINTDSHDVGHMDMMRYGVDVARRGWLEKDVVLNTVGYNEFIKWLKL